MKWKFVWICLSPVVKNLKNYRAAYFIITNTVRDICREKGPSYCYFLILCTSRVFLKIPKCLCNSTMHEEQVFFISFIKYPIGLRELSYLLARARAFDVGSVHYNSTVHACDVERMLCQRFNKLDSTNQSVRYSSNVL